MQNDFEQIELMIEEIKTFISFSEIDALKEYLEEIHSADLAEIFEELEENEKNVIFDLIDIEKATEILEELDANDFFDLLVTLDERKRHIILDEISKDDIVDKLSELPIEKADAILEQMPSEDITVIRKLLAYDPDVAGGIMTSDYITFNEKTIKSIALEELKNKAVDAEMIYYIFIVDDKAKLVGVISLRELILAEDNIVLDSIMQENIISVNVYDDQEEVAYIVSKYKLLAVPVIDNFGKLIGIITVDDIIDVIEEEATEDILKFAGTSEYEDTSDRSVIQNILVSVKARLPWLIITVFGGLFSATVVSRFQGTIDSYTLLALFMPLLAGMGGNVGTQSSTITVRNLAIGEIESRDIPLTIFHEVSVGFIVGILCALLVAVAAFLLHGELILSLIVGVSMTANIVTAATIGTLVPLVFHKLDIDPAIASAPFITTTVDITGLTIYFSLATYLISIFG